MAQRLTVDTEGVCAQIQGSSTAPENGRGPGTSETRGRKPLNWTPAQLAMLGASSDVEVMSRTGFSLSTISRKRKELGITASRAWTDDERGLLGTAIDRLVARAINRRAHAVGEERRRLGISACQPTSPAADELAGRDWYYERAGGATLREIAAKAARSITAVRAGIERYRARRGLPVINTGIGRPRESPRAKMPRTGYKIQWGKYEALLGTMSNVELAARIGCAPSAVLARRQRNASRPARHSTARTPPPSAAEPLGTGSECRMSSVNDGDK